MSAEVQIEDEVTGPEKPEAQTPAAERPEWLPEQFETPEEFAKAYGELRNKMSTEGAPKEAAPAEAPEGEPQAEPTAEQTQAAEAVENAGLDFSAVASEFDEKGELSDETFAKLEAGGIPRSMVESYIAGQVAQGEKMMNEVTTAVGGQETIDAMVAWARDGGITTDEAKAFNAAIDSAKDAASMTLALNGLKAKYEAANGKAPALVGGRPSAARTDVFQSHAQVVEAMRNPKYTSDPAYRAQVEEKLLRSNVF